MDYGQSLLLGIIEGLTEYLPVSSTGHLVLAGHFLGYQEDEFSKAFNVIIQLGAILAVVLFYHQKFFSSVKYLKNLMIAIFPTLVIGFLLKNKVDEWLGDPAIVGYSLIIGGIVLFFIDRFFGTRAESELNIKERSSLGIFQSLAMLPGVSRSGATLLGGAVLKLSRKEAAEYSFLMGAPTIAAATLYKLLKVAKHIESHQIGVLAVGTVVSFVFAMIAIKFFIGLITRYGLKPFAIYRVILGAVVLWSLR